MYFQEIIHLLNKLFQSGYKKVIHKNQEKVSCKDLFYSIM